MEIHRTERWFRLLISSSLPVLVGVTPSSGCFSTGSRPASTLPAFDVLIVEFPLSPWRQEITYAYGGIEGG